MFSVSVLHITAERTDSLVGGEPSLHERSLELTLTVPLRVPCNQELT